MDEIKGFTTITNKNRTQNLSLEFIDFFPTATVILNNNLVVTQENKSFEPLTGFSESLVGKSIIELFAEEKSEKLIDLIKKSFTNSIAYSAEIRIKVSDNRLLDVITIFRSFNDSVTNKKFCVLAFLDFTFQKMKEEVIRDNEARFKNMANTAPVMIWISDVEGLFSFVNRVWLEYSGGELGGQLGMNWLNNVHPEDVQKLLSSYQNALRLQDSFSVEFRFMDKDGKYEWMLIKGKPRFSTENMYMGFIGSCINIQEQKEIEDKISKINEELIQTISTRDKFFSIISHDLRSPLGGLMGILDVLNSSYENLDETEKKEIISDAALVSKTTYTLMENLLEWSRIKNGTISYYPEMLKIHQSIDNIASLYGQNLKKKEILFTNNTDPLQLAYADKSMTETILRNLVSNAIKFTNQGGSIQVFSEVKDKMLILGVRDSGVGIEQGSVPKLFRVDVSFSTKGTAKESGTGLGLIICKELAEKQGGEIWVESKKNEGSTFYFSVPLEK